MFENCANASRVPGIGHVRSPLTVDDAGRFATDGMLSIDVATTLASEAATQQLREQAYDLLARRLRIAAVLQGFNVTGEAESLFVRACNVLRSAAANAAASPARVTIVIEANILGPQLTWFRRKECLGDGPLFLLADHSSLRPRDRQTTRTAEQGFWRQLWQLRDNKYVQLAYAPFVTSQCPLLDFEHATGILPALGLQVPVGTAWIPMRLDISRFAGARGRLQRTALQNALHRCVDIGDLLHDKLSWPNAMMQHDAWLNRRLAIEVTGLGRLAQLRRRQPQAFSTLEQISRELRWVRSVLQHRSRQIAMRRRHLPALDLCDPTSGLSGDAARQGWGTRWRHAMESAATRHRNLMVLSPWSVFPTRGQADTRYFDLLPLVQFADAHAFARPPGLGGWKINEFKAFHQRAWAVIEQKDRNLLIAEQI